MSNIEDDLYIEEMSELKKSRLDDDAMSETNSICMDDFSKFIILVQHLVANNLKIPESRAVIRSMMISLGLIGLNQLCGLFAMLNYTVTIFKAAGSTLAPEMSAIIVAFIQLLGSFAPMILVERAGRRFLIILSACGIFVGQTILGTYSYLDTHGYNVENFKWVPLLSFAFAIFIGSWGVVTLPFLILSEITPPKVGQIL